MKTIIPFITFNKKAFNETLCNRKHKIIFICCSVALILLFVFFVVRSFCRPIVYQVRISDSLYDAYVAQNPDTQKLPFTFIKESDAHSGKIYLFGSVPVTAATITTQQTATVLSTPTSNAPAQHKNIYPLFDTYLLPTIAADANLSAPNLSIGLAKDFVPSDGTRALPIAGKYAGQEGYALTCTTSAVCTIYIEKIESKLNDWCAKTFVKKQVSTTTFVGSVGDIMVARGTQDILINDKNGVEKVFTTTLPVLRSNDLLIGNLEGVVTDRTQNATKTYTFKFKKAVLGSLKAAGFNYFMQTNNHCYDYGEDGFKDTLEALKEYSIPTSGAGHNLQEAKLFYHTTINGQPFAIISCGAYPVESTGFNGKTIATATDTRAGILWQSDDFVASVKAQKDAGYFVIVNVHGGEEYHFTPSKAQRAFYEQLCDAGADVVFGSHPHVLQKSEWYNGHLIVYSQGNFLFNGMTEMKGATDSEIVRIGILNGKIVYCETYPATLGTTSVSLKK